MKDERAFDEAYAKLNAAQKQAVDTVEGPVLVIAGPGTGKTHILTLRIANILRVTDAKPDSILVLTFTDSAARTITRRLATFIGEERARKVQTFTFHSFAAEILKKHPEAFGEFAEQRLMGEVEQVLLWRSVLEDADIQYLRTAKSPFFYLKDLKALEDDLTRERITLEAYQAWLAEEESRIQADDSLRYVRGEKQGEMKPDGFKRLERLEKGKEALRLIETFRAEKAKRGVYGYTDVLRIAVDTIAEDDALRADLQEQYQYVLADEHQDANALQHALLDALAFDEHPNLFIVGDEKQAIFGFQGADNTHFNTFFDRYPRTTLIPLTENYRSYQGILDLAHSLLGDLPSSTGEHIQLSAFRKGTATMQLLTAADPLAERDQIATLVETAIAEGVPPHEIAIITMKNKTADLFALHLRARGIPTLRAGDVDIEGRPTVRALLALMEATGNPLNQAAFRDALLAPWWDVPFAERAAFLQRYRNYELVDALAQTFPTLSHTLTKLQIASQELSPLPFFSKLLGDTGARSYFLSDARRVEEDLPLVRQLIMYVEDLVRREPNATWAEIMLAFSKAREHELGSIKTSVTEQEGQVTVITAHKAKGMEFQRVFVTSLTKSEWESAGRASLVPSPLSKTRDLEEVVRLFYVALTRAKDVLTLSYAAGSGDGKEVAPMQLLPSGLTPIEPEAAPLPVFHYETNAPALVRELTLRYLTHDGLSPSAYNEYLASPACFFARRVLHLKEPENEAIVIGNAVHAGIAGYLSRKDEPEDDRVAAAHAELTRSLNRSLLPRTEAFDQMSRHARASLDSYLSSELLTREPVAIEEAFSVKRTVAGTEVLLRGKVDAVFKHDNGECIVDFKTSTSVTGKKEAFERQLAFYDLLLRANDHETTSALIIQVSEKDVTEHPVELSDATRAELLSTLDEVLTELITGKWRAATEASDYDGLLSCFGN
jgi:DNA helicase-2/ATP-dependent DNA helicase PcrA